MMAFNNATNNNNYTWYGPSFVGVKYTTVSQYITSTGDTTLYTVPSDKRVIVGSISVINKDAVNTNTIYFKVNVSSTDYQITGSTSVAASGTLDSGNMLSMVFEPGDILKINNTRNTLVNLAIMEYAKEIPLYSPRVLSISTTDTTLYTVPANKKAMVCYPLRTNVTAYYLNLSGSNKNITCNFVNSGGSISTNNQFLPSKLVPNNSLLGTIPGAESAFASLSAGDFVNITVSATTATQTAWVTVYEV